MFSLFRRIRLKNFRLKQFRQYLLYACGEIILVVIGILIALQINNWNEDRKDRIDEKKILTSLAEDLKSNRQELETKKNYIKERINLELQKLALRGIADENLSDAQKKIIVSTGFVLIDIIDGTLTSVLNSEKLEIISNEDLKKMLTSHPAFIEKLKKQETLIEDYVLNKQRPLHRKYISLTDFITEENPLITQIKQNSFVSDYYGLLQNMDYYNICVGIVLSNEGFYERAALLLKETDKLLSTIETELNK